MWFSKIKLHRAKTFLALTLLATSVLTLGLPKEFFDPHVGIDYDVFCKSLYSVGLETQAPESLFTSRYFSSALGRVNEYIFYEDTTASNILTRAPPE